MRVFRGHPTLSQLSDFPEGSDGAPHGRVAAHLESCQTCRDSLQLLRSATVAATQLPNSGPSAALRARVLESHAAGARTILPERDAPAQTPRRWQAPLAAAVLLVVLGSVVLARQTREVEAGTTSGTLVFTPSALRAGQSVAAHYRPSGALSGHSVLVLRARLRSANSDAYNRGTTTTTVTALHRDTDGEFTGRFVLPDSVLYAAFAVEADGGTVVDDNGSRDWELLRSNTAGTPLLESLIQRANDLMGRNWEEGYATAQRMVALYPSDLRAWIWKHSFDVWLARADDDSVRTLHHVRLVAFDSTFRAGAPPSSEQLGLLAWYAQGIDSVIGARWYHRLLREAPTNSYAMQWRLVAAVDSFRMRKDTAAVFRDLDTLWAQAPRDRDAQIATYATSLALVTSDTSLIHRWADRLVRVSNDRRHNATWVAAAFASIPALRAEGIARLRNELAALTRLAPSERYLGETLSQQRLRHADTRRHVLATLGQALVASGDYTGGRAVLGEAASSGWDLGVFRAVQTASLALGDTARALSMAANIAVDPRTPAAFVDSVAPLAQRILGAAGWHARLDSAQTEFVARELQDASARSLRGDVRVQDLKGRTQRLKSLTDGHVTVVAFWSRFCVPALEDLPHLNTSATQLARRGIRVVSIIDEPNVTDGLKTFLQERHITVPVYLDAWHEASSAFDQWGTPYYYVVDTDGRVRFGVVTAADQAIVRAVALQLSQSPSDFAKGK